MHLTGNPIPIVGGAEDIGRGLAAHGGHAVRASRSSVTARSKLSMRRRVCSYVLWRLQRSEISLIKRLGNLDDERLEALGIRRHEIEAVLTATLEVLAQAASEAPAAHSGRAPGTTLLAAADPTQRAAEHAAGGSL